MARWAAPHSSAGPEPIKAGHYADAVIDTVQRRELDLTVAATHRGTRTDRLTRPRSRACRCGPQAAGSAAAAAAILAATPSSDESLVFNPACEASMGLTS